MQPPKMQVSMSLSRRLAIALITALFCVTLCNPITAQHETAAQRHAAALAPTANFSWKNVLPELKHLIQSRDFHELSSEGPVNVTLDSITETSYLAGDGTPFALIDLGGLGAYTDGVIPVRVVGGHPAFVRFVDGHGKFSDDSLFAQGASVMHAVSVSFAPDKHALYEEHLSFASDGDVHDASQEKVETCEIVAYQWVASTQSLDWNSELSREMQRDLCRPEFKGPAK